MVKNENTKIVLWEESLNLCLKRINELHDQLEGYNKRVMNCNITLSNMYILLLEFGKGK